MDTFDVADWRRRVFVLYAEVRAASRAGDHVAAHARWCAGRDDLFARHRASPLLPADRSAFTGLHVADYHPAYRFEVAMRATAPGAWSVETGTDGTVDFDRIGVVRLPGLGDLDVWRLTSYGGGVFVPMRDGLSGQPGGGYGGGRYLLDTVKGADLGGDADRLVVDLNFAYAPSCAYDPAWACPLAPAGNTLTAAVPVGELAGRVGAAAEQ